LLAAACWSPADPISTYQLGVHGAVEVTATGRTEHGPAGTPEEPYYTITLGGPEGVAAVVFTSAGAEPPPVGAYPVRERGLGESGFSALIITGRPSHPSGVFHVQSGTITIVAATPERLAGRFELRATGFLTESPADDTREVVAEGSFAAPGSGHDTLLTFNPGQGR
jgi:hypothetical protein